MPVYATKVSHHCVVRYSECGGWGDGRERCWVYLQCVCNAGLCGNVPPCDATPSLPQVVKDPVMDLIVQPVNVVGRVIALCHLSLFVCGARDIHNVHQHICASEVIQELVERVLGYQLVSCPGKQNKQTNNS